MTDTIEKLGNSLIQHGKENDRIYLMKLEEENYTDVIESLDDLAKKNSYTKIIAKVPENAKDFFVNNGFTPRAYIQNFYQGKEDVFFVSKFFSKDRDNFKNKNEVFNIIQLAMEKSEKFIPLTLEKGYNIEQLTSQNIPAMTSLYKDVFESYPFPIFDENYILKTMNDNIDYFGAFFEGRMVAVASCEMDVKNQNAEMTDFATLPKFRGNHLAWHLLKAMEKSARKKGIKTAYTIARAKSISMNVTFAKMGYEFGGTLVNNTNICGQIESMNVWYKKLYS